MTDPEWRAALADWRREYMEFAVEASYHLRRAMRKARENQARAAELVCESRELRSRARELRAARPTPRRHELNS